MLHDTIVEKEKEWLRKKAKEKEFNTKWQIKVTGSDLKTLNRYNKVHKAIIAKITKPLPTPSITYGHRNHNNMHSQVENGPNQAIPMETRGHTAGGMLKSRLGEKQSPIMLRNVPELRFSFQCSKMIYFHH